MKVLDESQVRARLRIDELIEAMRRVMVEYSRGEWNQPLRSILAQHDGFFGIMPASGRSMGAKLVTFYPGNDDRRIPTHMAVVALFDSATGEPLAIMDGRYITEVRTAAVSAVATRAMAGAESRVLALLGAGVQAAAHLEVLSHVLRFEEVRVWSRTRERAERFAAKHGIRATDREEAVRDADVIVTATNATEPVLEGAWLKPGAHVNAIGAARPDWRELDDRAMSNVVVVDSFEGARHESGDVILSGVSPYAELGEVLDGRKPVRVEETTVFKSLGMAVQDVATAELVFRAEPR